MIKAEHQRESFVEELLRLGAGPDRVMMPAHSGEQRGPRFLRVLVRMLGKDHTAGTKQKFASPLDL